LSDESDLLTCIIQLGAIYGDLTMSTGDKIGIYTNIYICIYIYYVSHMACPMAAWT
jgi:hypothetical protein